MNTISLMLDCSRNAVCNKRFLKDFIDILAKCGYNQLQLYMEDTYKIDQEPFFGYFRGGFTVEDLKEIDGYAFSKGIELVPAIQTLGHLGTIFNWGEYNAIHDVGDCLLAGNEETYTFIEKMIKQISSTFKTHKVNIGMDESFWSGKGEYLKRYGYKNPDEIYIEHLIRVSQILKKYDRQGMMWGDMFYRNMNNGEYYSKNPMVSEKTKKLIPNNIDIIYWDYYNKDESLVSIMAKNALELKSGAYFAGGLWSWIGFMPNNEYAISQSKVALKAVKDAGINDYIATFWGDNGGECSKLSPLPAIYYFAKLAKGIYDDEIIKKEFEKEFGLPMDSFISLNDINNLDHSNEITNVCKYMLYNDPMIGIYDNTVNPDKKCLFTKAAMAYEPYTHNGKFGYIFKTAQSLASALELKYDLGIRIRNAYRAKDINEIKNIILDIDKTIERIQIFYKDFKYQWYKENKLEGFEIQSQRIGGMILRLGEIKDLLISFINGEIKTIEPLEEDVLNFADLKKGEDRCVNNYSICASVNVH